MGGAAEARQSHPDRIRLVLKNRKGFVKVALTTGTDIGNEYIYVFLLFLNIYLFNLFD